MDTPDLPNPEPTEGLAEAPTEVPIEGRPRSRRRRRQIRLGVAITLIAVITLGLWLRKPLAAARVWGAVGQPARSWQAALAAEPGEVRDRLLERAWQADPGIFAGPERSGHRNQPGALQEVPYPYPQWTAYGPHGRDIHRLVGSTPDWPWLHCASGHTRAEIETALEKSRERVWFHLEIHVADPTSHCNRHIDAVAELIAHTVDPLLANRLIELLAAVGVDPTTLTSELPDRFEFPLHGSRYPRIGAIRNDVGAAALELCTGTPGRAQRHLLTYRLGHLPDRIDPNLCVFCGPITAPAPGVTQAADGTLTWIRPDGTEAVTPEIRWLPGMR